MQDSRSYDKTADPLDGEYLDSQIHGTTTYSVWNDIRSGDGIAGGDYRAMFSIYHDSFTTIR